MPYAGPGFTGGYSLPNISPASGVGEVGKFAQGAGMGTGIGIAAGAVPALTEMAGLGEVAPAAQGALSGAGMGASLGTMAGGPVGTAIGAGVGALAGGVTSALGKGGGSAKPGNPKSEMPSVQVAGVGKTPLQNTMPSTANNPQKPTQKSFAMNLLKGYS